MIAREPRGLDERIEQLSPGKLDQLLKRLQDKRRSVSHEIQPVPRNPQGVPLSFAQERLWFLDQLQPGSAVYNVPTAFRLSGAVHANALECALAGVVQRQEALRTIFASAGGRPVQVVAPEGRLTLPRVDLRALPPAAREDETARLRMEEARRPFDLAEGPLLRTALLGLGEGEHVLLLTLHHIVADAWSLGVLIRDLAALYQAALLRKPAELSELAVQYVDYVAWQRGGLHAARLEAQLAYWKDRLAGLPILDLPTDRSRPVVQSGRGRRRSERFPDVPLAALKALAEDERATLFISLLAGFEVLLSRYSGQEDVAVGTPVANRNRAELEGLVGFFVNTVILRGVVREEMTGREWLREVRDTALAAYAHQEIPFERLVEELRPERSLDRNPLVQVLFSVQNAPLALGWPETGLSLTLLDTDNGTAKLDLNLMLWEEPHGLSGMIEYSSDLFEAATVSRLTLHFETLLAGLAADPDRPVAELPLLSEPERHVLVAWNDTLVERPEICLQWLIEEQARRQPDRIALVFEGESLSYAGLEERANRLAHRLRALGVEPEVTVGVCLERSLDLVISLLAVFKAGGAYVPLEPSLPTERLAWMLEESAIQTVVADSGTAGALPAFGEAGMILLDLEREELARLPSFPPASVVSPANLAYVIFTSGSSGRPKGVMNRHGAVGNRMIWMDEAYGSGPEERVLQKTPFSFDVSVWDMFWPLMNGLCLVVARPGGHRDSAWLVETLVSEQITWAHFVPSMLRTFLDEAGVERCTALRRVSAAGEALSPDLVERLSQRLGADLLNLYGPTEAAIEVSHWLCEPGRETVPIGRPIDNVGLHVLDRRMRPVPIGVPGQLYIGGVALARGYARRPDLTAGVFLPDPFAIPREKPGNRIYATGDLVRWLSNGDLEYLGRIDHQVKIRGYRIEPGEVEGALLGHPSVREAVVVVREDRPGDKRLVAYVLPAGESQLPVATLRRFLRESLPEYMVPSAFVRLEALPLTSSGKVDRRALPAPEGALPVAADSYVAPRTPVEELLADIWAEVLGLERVGADESFFELGGHSLLATRMVSQLRDTLGLELPLRAVFESPTLEGLARRVTELRSERVAKAMPIRPVRRDGELPLSFAQQRLWFLDRMVPDNPFYNVYHPVELSGFLDVEVLRRSFQEIVRRHEVLRTSFDAMGGRPVQVIYPEVRLAIPMIDLQGLASERRREELSRLSWEEGRRPFDLSRSPLLRLHVVRTVPERHVLLVNMHHIVSDGWSSRVLVDELAALYEAFLQGERSPLPELPIQYADFAVWQRQWFQGELFQRQLDYWKRRLEGISEAPLELPIDHPRPAIESFRGCSESFRLKAPVVRELRALGRWHRATLFMVFLSGYKSLLSRYSGQQDVAVGSGIANRNRREIEDLIGFFVNTLVLRTDLSGLPSFEDVLLRVRQTTVESYDHQDLPFEMLVEELRPERSLNRNPLVQVMLAFQNFPRSARSLRGLSVLSSESQWTETGTAKFDLALFVFELGEELALEMQYSADLFDRVTVRRLLSHLERLLESAVANPQALAAELPMLSEAEQAQVLREWSDTALPCPQEPLVHELFAGHARLRPEAPAIASWDGRRLSYGELEARSNRLAHHLRILGVGPEVRVAVAAERTYERVVGIVAVLKAGGAYVTLSPGYPRERLAWLLEDASAPVVLTQESVRDQLPETRAEVICLDGDWSSICGREDRAPASGVLPENLAYVVYTSGSTGKPKGVEIPHAGLMNLVRWYQHRFELRPGDRGTQVASPAFDASVVELWPFLAGGGEVHIPDEETRLSSRRMMDWWAEVGITLAYLVTPLAEAVLEELETGEADGARLAVRSLFTGGDQLHRRPGPQVSFTLWNTYGPAEYSVTTSAVAVAPADGTADLPTIGRALPNTRIYLLDRLQQPVPIGVAGELFVAGLGLARGYLRRPELTAERFVPDPFAGEPGARMYRTGDLVKWLADGDLDFLGRIDHQVKLRGFRIELGEIETVLGQHPAVCETAVLVREDRPGDKRLVAYVVEGSGATAEPVEAPEPWKDEQVSQWGDFFDGVYRREAPDPDPTFNIIGWDSTYSGLPLPAEEMQEWLADTVARILDLQPRRVLEIGCGTGLVLFRVAGRCESYWGTDVSEESIRYLEGQLAGLPERLPQVHLAQRSAAQFDGFAPGTFDTVVMNSVVQYFPGVDYLVEVLSKAVSVLCPGGAIFLGDVRSLPLQRVFHTGIELFRAEPELPLEVLRQRVQARSLSDAELQVSPSLFYALKKELPRISRVEVYPKRGWAHNELTQFRYQVVLRVEGETPAAEPPSWLDWSQEDLSLEGLRRHLREEGPVTLGLRGVPNQRVAEMAEAARLLFEGEGIATAGELRQRSSAARGLEPQAFWDLAEEVPYEVELGWASPQREGRFDVVLRRRGVEVWRRPDLAAWLPGPELAPVREAWTAYANDPLQGRVVRQLIPELRSWLGERLPEYMVPSSFVLLDALPLTPNGKVDRKALPAPEERRSEAGEGPASPSNPIEELLAGIWAEVLRLDRVGVHDNFFELGGHSLLATQVVSRVRDVLGLELPVRRLFTAPTVAELARDIQAEGQAGPLAPPITPLPPALRRDDLPLSFAQQRLWLIDQLEPGNPAYNVPSAVRLTGELSVDLLERIFAEVVRRHEALRTRFVSRDGRPVQVIAPAWAPELPVVDLSHLPAARREPEARTLTREEGGRPFDLERGPLLRMALVRMAGQEHLLLLTLRHIVSDGWSVGVLLREVAALHEAFRKGLASPLPPLPVQYADFAVWQRGWLQGAVLEEQLEHWKRRLAGAPRVLELPTDRPRRAVQTFRGAGQPVVLPPMLSQALAALCRREGVTAFMTLLASWALLLGRHAGEEDVLVGTPIAGRNRREIEDLIGFFVNTLVLRTDLSGAPSFHGLLGRVREVALDAYAHQDIPFERLVEELVIERDLAVSPLFQAFFVLQNAPLGPLHVPGLTLEPVQTAGEVAKFDLSLALTETPEGIEGGLEHNTDLFDASTAERMVSHFLTLLEGAVTAPGTSLLDLPLLSEAERHVLVAWNDTLVERPEICLHWPIEEQARRHPDRIALVFEGESLSYAGLEERANCLAHRLRALGVEPDVPVGVCLERSLDLVICLLAVLKAGGAYVPLDPSLPAERLAWMLEESAIQVVVADSGTAGALPAHGEARVICLDLEPEELSHLESAPPASVVSPGNLAYVIFTSGSTGRPKGVMVPHRGVCNRLRWAQQVYQLDESDAVLQKASFGFDFSVWECFAPLWAGARLVLAEPDRQGDGPYLVRVLREHRVTFVHFVPSMLAAFLGEDSVETCGSLRQVFSGGEVLTPELRDRVLARLSAPLDNQYGPTEISIDTTRWVCAPGQEPHRVPIGRPIANSRLYVVDPELRPVPIGVAGELLVGGAGVTRGYLRRPDLTADRFTPDPFSDGSGGRLYRTGDLARWLPDGCLDFLGRLDHQVKVRGFRIELGEIEVALSAHPGVRQAVVLAEGEHGADRRLVAYAVEAAGEAPDPSELRGFLRERLPEFMLPAAFVFLPALPLTANEKVDRKVLAKLRPERTAAIDEGPRTPAEELLAGIFAEALQVERIGVHESFFEQGGHSLLATRVISRVREVFEVELPVRELFEAPTVAGLADRIRQAMQSAERALPPPIQPLPREGDLPLSFAQARLWFLDQLEPGGAAYNIPAVFSLSGPLDVQALRAAFSEVLRRHEALRTVFPEVAGRPVQRISAPAEMAVPVMDLTALAAGPQKAVANSLTADEVRRAFELVRGPLLRCHLVRLGELEHLLLLNMHHIVSDGWSMGVLVREICALYPALQCGRASPLAALPIQYADFAYWQRHWLQGEVLEAELRHWREHLDGAPAALELPTDRPRPAVQTLTGASLAFGLPRDLSERLQLLGRRLGATLFMTLLSAFQELLGRYSGQSDLTVGTPVAGRTNLQTEALIGFFVNMLVVRTDLSAEPSFATLVGRVRETLLSAYAHQDLPFESLVEELRPERSLSHAPLYQVVLALQNTPTAVLKVEELSFEPVAVETGTAKFDLTMTLQETERGLVGAAEYNTDLFDGATVRRLIRHWEALLAGVVSAPERRLSDLEWVTPEERIQVLLEWNDTSRPCAQRPMVHELFARHAALRPEETAVASPEGRLSYGEVERRANRLAWHLRGLGVGPDVVVAVCSERTLLRVVAVVAVLKAGGAYLSLDPAYPEERLAFLLADARAPVLLTEARFAGCLPRSGARVLCLDEDWDSIEGEESKAPGSGVEPEHLAYLVYTSGSTGRPKGVEIPHAGLINLVRWHQDLFGVLPEDRGTQIASPAFDASIWELWPYLAAGASVHIPAEESRLSSPGMIRWWSEQGITLAYLMTPLAEGVLEERIPAGLDLRVRALIIGGDRLHRGPDPGVGFRLMNTYGPAEYTVVSTVVEVPPQGRQTGLPTIGRAIDNTRIYILDPWLRPVPVGVAGELYVTGIGLARGYHERPDLTAEKFVPDPFSEEPGGRMYRTADRVRLLADGDMDFLERLDHQVKVRGLRIELGEIETVLGQHADLREVVVSVREDRPGDKRLVAYVVAAGDRRPAAEELRSFLAERLPEYMVPPTFVVLESLPLTPNGKVDRQALPVPEWSTVVSSAAPRTPAEELLAGIFAEVLGLERVGVEDDFFRLGGHSLMATRLVSRLREVFGRELPLRLIFESPTVTQLAERIAPLRGGQPAPTIRPVPRDRDLPLSFAQQRLWFIDQMEPGSPAYNVPLALRLTGGIDPRLLARIFSEIVRRHEVLRTTFTSREGSPVQVIASPEPVALPLIDLSCLPVNERERQARDLAAAEARLPFDLQRGPLMRLLLVRQDEADHLLLLTLHHVVSDGWSMGVLLREIAALHEAFSQDLPSPLAELPVQYADFAVWQRSWLQGEILEEQLGYWRQRLAGAPAVLDLPLDRPRPAAQTYRGALRPLHLGPDLSRAVGELCRRLGATPFMALLAAWAILLGRHTGQDDVPVGVPIAGRNRREVEDLIGFFVNTLVLCSDLSGDPSLGELLSQVRETSLDAFTHQDLPFERLVEEVVVERNLAVSPLFQVLFVMQNTPLGDLVVPDLVLSPLDTGAGLAKFDLSLFLAESPGGFAGSLRYAADLFEPSTAERLIAGFQTLLACMAGADPGRPLLSLEVLSEAERCQLLVEWSAREEGASALSLPELVELQAKRRPDAVAVVFEAERWTYADLSRRSRDIAGFLHGQGVGPGDRVAILDRRSAERVARILGVLASGASYVAIDSTQPLARRTAILADVAPVWILPPRPPLPLEGGGDIGLRVTLLPEADTLGAPRSCSSDGVECLARAEGPAYVVYTSGSTGRPKGILAHHRGAATYLEWVIRNYGLSASDVALQLAPLTFDASLRDTFAPLAAGGQIVIVPDDAVRDPAALLERMEEHGVTCLPSIVPSLLRLLVEEALASGRRVPSLRLILASGETLHGADAAAVRRALGEVVSLVNQYGASEATMASTWHPVRVEDESLPALPAGRPAASTRQFLLDRGLRPVPPGAAGEICFGGPGLTYGYLGQPDRTAEAFVPDPFGAPGERLYRTGDRGRYRPDGVLELLGRIDFQVKIRGQRVEPGEVEAVLRSHPAIREVVVAARGEDEPRLAAWLVGEDVAADELRSFLAERLPAPMIPSDWVFLDALPLTPHGKVDRARLPEPRRERGAVQDPRDRTELRLVHLWEEVLGVQPVGIADDFFALGGHSLSAVRLMAGVRHDFGRTLPLSELFRRPTIEALADLLRRGERDLPWSPLVSLAAGREGEVPLFCVHGAGGHVLAFADLARSLRTVGEDRPLFALEARGVSDGQPPLERVEEMAELYLAAIREVRPHGPYRLLGYSMGSKIAFEMACRLERQGEVVERLAAIDVLAVPRTEEAVDLEIPEEIRALPGFDSELAGRQLAVWRANREASRRWIPRHFGGNVFLLVAEEGRWAGDEEPTLGWAAVAEGGIEVVSTPGDHFSLLRPPHVQVLAGRLSSWLS